MNSFIKMQKYFYIKMQGKSKFSLWRGNRKSLLHNMYLLALQYVNIIAYNCM